MCRITPRVAALYVDEDGVYSEVEDVEVWGESRDARNYDSGLPVVCHPPCERWSIMAACRRQRDGRDGGCFQSALEMVRGYGGVLEHPAFSLAWDVFGLNTPPPKGGWLAAGDGVGKVCQVSQGAYGFPSEKRTWLYAARSPKLPELKWGRVKCASTVCNDGHKNPEMSRALRSMTTHEFRDVLLSIARSCPKLVRVW